MLYLSLRNILVKYFLVKFDRSSVLKGQKATESTKMFRKLLKVLSDVKLKSSFVASKMQFH